MLSYSSNLPFAGYENIAVVVPSRLEGLVPDEVSSLKNIPLLLWENRRALERELGAPIRLTDTDPQFGARWLIGPAAHNPDLARLRAPMAAEEPPALVLDRSQGLLITDAATPAGVWETFSLLRSLARFPGGMLTVAGCATLEEAARRIVEEVGDSYPAFGLRNLDWNQICARHYDRILGSPTPVAAMQEWLAELQDGHTWVRPIPPHGDLPYRVRVDGRTAVFDAVPRGTAAWEAGVRAGFELLGEDATGWWLRTAATPHSRALVAGRRLLGGPPGTVRQFHAISPQGKSVAWQETIPAPRWDPVASFSRLASGAGYLRINAWLHPDQLEASIDEAFDEFRGVPGLIVDLRGNPGGDIALAHRFRDRFLSTSHVMGAIRYSQSPGVLSEPEPIHAEPAPPEKRWTGRVHFLTDALTYSASEDALLGLQGLPQVRVIGEPSGGGSGRLRVLHLLPGWRLTVSTALTYDRHGRCIEGAGIPVDLLVSPAKSKPGVESAEQENDPVLIRADSF